MNPPTPPCLHCGASATRVCGACEFAPYCGERCAALDWPLHLEREPHAHLSGEATQVNPLDLVWAPGLYLGGISALNHLDVNSIDAVLTVVQRNERNDPDWLASKVGTQRSWLWLSHADTPEENMSGDFIEATDFIDEHLRAGRRVLVHCHAGMSRSATMVAAYLLRFHPQRFPSADSAIAYLQGRRWIVDPNPGFRKQLEGWAQRWNGRDRG